MKRIRLAAFLFILLTSLFFSGCRIGMDVETLLRPPHPRGEQKKIQQALEKYLNSQKDEKAPDVLGGYVLKYPKSGEYRSAFVLKDLDGDGREEAIVFYGRIGENSNVHLNLLKNSKGGWQSIGDIEGVSSDIDRIQFGDLDGDGVYEVLIGWNIVNIRDRQLVLYYLKNNIPDEWHKELYSEFVVGKLTDSGRDSLMILHANPAENITTARLLETDRDKTTGEQVLAELGSTRLDGYIEQFSAPRISTLTDTQMGVYVDGTRSTGMVTELIYWDGTQLRAPFYNKVKDTTQITFRNASLPSMDLDGDGYIEWPVIEPLKGYSNPAENKVWLTKWQSWDFDNQRAEDDFSCIINLTDKYYLSIDKSWKGSFTLLYEKQSHTLTLFELKNGVPSKKIMILRAVYKSALASTTTALTGASVGEYSGEPVLQELQDMPDVKFLVWFSTDNAFRLDMNRIIHMFTYLR